MRKYGLYAALAAVALLGPSPASAAAMQEFGEAEDAAARITARSWVVVESPGGKIVAEKNAAARGKVGGFSKLMTALVVARLAAATPALLDERVAFEESFLKAGGTMSGLSVGESMTVRDALYAVLVGSANDATVALVRKFNNRFAESNFRQLEELPLHSRAFIAEMNRTARALGMKDSLFRSSYADGGAEDERTSSAHDLARAMIAVTESPVLREIVGTKLHSAAVTRVDGTTRSQSWRTSNRLLGSMGVDGGAVSATPRSGHSVVLALANGKRRYVVVVLGSESSHQRFADATTVVSMIK